VLSSFRSLSRPCSGRTVPVPHFGPPTAPRNTASAFLHAVRTSSVRGEPVASIAACQNTTFSALIHINSIASTYSANQLRIKVELNFWFCF